MVNKKLLETKEKLYIINIDEYNKIQKRNGYYLHKFRVEGAKGYSDKFTIKTYANASGLVERLLKAGFAQHQVGEWVSELTKLYPSVK